MMTSSWFFTRIVILQMLTYYLWTEVEYKAPEWKEYTIPIAKGSAFFLTILCILHVYWFILMMLMLKGFLKSGKREDN